MKTFDSSLAHRSLMWGAATLVSAPLEAQATRLFYRKLAMILALALPMISMHAQPTVEWAAVIGGWGNDGTHDLALTPGGQLYLVGAFEQEVVGNYERPTKVLYKFDLDGTLIASQTSRGESIHAVAVDSQGNCHQTGDIWQPATLGVGRYQDLDQPDAQPMANRRYGRVQLGATKSP